MKKFLLATVASVALAAGGAVAAESGKDQSGMKAGGAMKGQAASPAQTTGSGAADAQAKPQTGLNGGADSKARTDMKTGADSKAATDSKAGASIKGKSETTGAGSSAQSQSGAPTQPSSPDIKRQGSGSASGMKSGGQAGGAAAESAGSTQTRSSATTTGSAGGSVSLTQDQRAKIRTTVIAGGKAPKIERSQINFSLNVGTVVPRSVRVVAVPPTLVEIHPAWRGYMYFVVGDELVIVEPRTLKIVAVLTV
jgi:hypothetical protein